MKILSSKKYEDVVQKLTDLALDLEQEKSDNSLLHEQVMYLTDQLSDERFTTAKLESDLLDAKKEVKKLKTLLTRNKITYKKEK